MDQDGNNVAFLKSACQRSLRDRWRNSRKALAINGLSGDPHSAAERPSGLGWWAIVLIEFSGISLLAKFEKGLHLLLHEFSAALFAQVDLILVDDHDPHAFPLFPAGFTDLGFDLRFKPPHEEGIRDSFSGLSTRDALDVCHGVSILPHILLGECEAGIVTLRSCEEKRGAD